MGFFVGIELDEVKRLFKGSRFVSVSFIRNIFNIFFIFKKGIVEIKIVIASFYLGKFGGFSRLWGYGDNVVGVFLRFFSFVRIVKV